MRLPLPRGLSRALSLALPLSSWVASGAARAEAPRYPARVMLGVGGGVAEGGAGAQGTLRVLLQGERLAGEFGAREGLYSGDARTLGSLFFGGRWTPPGAASLRLGFSHHHEVPMAVLEEQPVGAAIGSAPGIRHRSGLEAGLGLRLPLDTPADPGRLGVGLEAAVSWLPDPAGPPVYGFVDLVLTVDAGRPRGG